MDTITKKSLSSVGTHHRTEVRGCVMNAKKGMKEGIGEKKQNLTVKPGMKTVTNMEKEYQLVYRKQTKHRKRCRVCNKLIQDGAKVRMMQFKSEKYYPVKGIMRFTTWKFEHSECTEIRLAEARGSQ